jgi:hypothetical protein
MRRRLPNTTVAPEKSGAYRRRRLPGRSPAMMRLRLRATGCTQPVRSNKKSLSLGERVAQAWRGEAAPYTKMH